MGDWEEALEKYNASREEAAALANSQAAVMETRAMSLAEGQSAPFLAITCHHGSCMVPYAIQLNLAHAVH